MTKCLSCGHITPEIELNCPECGSFYTLVVDADSEEYKSENVMEKLKQKLDDITTIDKIHKEE